MFKNLLIILTILLFIGCEESNPFGSILSNNDEEDEISTIVFELDTRLEKDVNGYPILKVNPNVFQTTHRISGNVYRNGNPVNIIKFGWMGNLYWVYGDTDGYVKVIDNKLEYICVTEGCVPPTEINEGYLVPTINGASYSNMEGEVNTMVGVINMMINDTLTIHYGWYDNWRSEEVYSSFKILLR